MTVKNMRVVAGEWGVAEGSINHWQHPHSVMKPQIPGREGESSSKLTAGKSFMQTSACIISCCSRAVKNWRTESLEAEASEPLVADMMGLSFCLALLAGKLKSVVRGTNGRSRWLQEHAMNG